MSQQTIERLIQHALRLYHEGKIDQPKYESILAYLLLRSGENS